MSKTSLFPFPVKAAKVAKPAALKSTKAVAGKAVKKAVKAAAKKTAKAAIKSKPKTAALRTFTLEIRKVVVESFEATSLADAISQAKQADLQSEFDHAEVDCKDIS